MTKKKIIKNVRDKYLRKTSEYCTLSSVLLLTGCMGIYEGGFECPAGVGVGCKSISDVNNLVNQGEIPKIPSEQLDPEKLEIWYAPQGRAQYSVFGIQKDTSINSDKPSIPKKTRRRGTYLSDA